MVGGLGVELDVPTVTSRRNRDAAEHLGVVHFVDVIATQDENVFERSLPME